MSITRRAALIGGGAALTVGVDVGRRPDRVVTFGTGGPVVVSRPPLVGEMTSEQILPRRVVVEKLYINGEQWPPRAHGKPGS